MQTWCEEFSESYHQLECFPSQWHSTACHLGTRCQRQAGRWDGHDLTRLLGWIAAPAPNPSHCEAPRNRTGSPPGSHDATTGTGWRRSAGTGQRRWCKSSRQMDWKKRRQMDTEWNLLNCKLRGIWKVKPIWIQCACSTVLYFKFLIYNS